MTIATKEENRVRLERLLKVLEERGVVDIKFDVVKGSNLDDVIRDKIEVLQAVVDGRHTKLHLFGDSVRVPNCG